MSKSKEASQVLQLMDEDEDANYCKALKAVLASNKDLVRATLEAELCKYI